MGRNRRHFLSQLAVTLAGLELQTGSRAMLKNGDSARKPYFEISLAEWSFHRTLEAGKMTNIDFPARAKKEFQIDAVEYVDSFSRTR